MRYRSTFLILMRVFVSIAISLDMRLSGARNKRSVCVYLIAMQNSSSKQGVRASNSICWLPLSSKPWSVLCKAVGPYWLRHLIHWQPPHITGNGYEWAVGAADPEDEREEAGCQECKWQRARFPARFENSCSTTRFCAMRSAGLIRLLTVSRGADPPLLRCKVIVYTSVEGIFALEWRDVVHWSQVNAGRFHGSQAR